jgi:hypothetical protein
MSERIPPTPEYDAEKQAVITELEAAGKEHASARAKARYYEDAEKPTLADIIRKRADTEAADIRKLYAQADAGFRAFLKEKHQAAYASDLAYLRLERARIAVEIFRSRWSLVKTMMENGQ